jgi:uncharacterized protein
MLIVSQLASAPETSRYADRFDFVYVFPGEPRPRPCSLSKPAEGCARRVQMPQGKGGSSKRGFAAMDEKKQREIASKGGKASHEGGRGGGGGNSGGGRGGR